MPNRIGILFVIVPLLTAGAAAVRADESSMVSSILPKGGLFGILPDKSAAKRPAPDVSGTPASNTSYWTEEQGGLFGFAGIEAAERCTGKLCNAYYGDAPPDETALPAASGRASNVPPLIAPSVPESEPRGVALVRRECAPNPQDPWRCYR